MSALSIFDISGRAMSAQLVRLNTTASNLANAGTVAGSEKEAFRSLKPVFRTVMDGAGRATVAVDQVTVSKMAPSKRHDPSNPLPPVSEQCPGPRNRKGPDQRNAAVGTISHDDHLCR